MAIDKEKLKVLFWRPEFYGAITDGGVPSLYNGLTGGFLKLGHECMFASGGRLKLHPDIKTYFIPYSNFFRNFPEVLCLPYNKKSIKAVSQIIKDENPNFIFQHHHDFHYGGSMIKKEFGIPFLLHCDSVEYWIKKNWGKLYLPHLLKWAEEIQWEQSDAVFVISETLRQQLIELGVNSDKIIINPNGVHPEIFSPELDGAEIKKKLGIEDKYICGFTGTFGQWHGLEVIAKSIKSVVEKIPNAFFLFVGDGVLRNKVEEIIKRDNVEKHCLITGMVNYEYVPRFLAACDLLLSPCVRNEDDSGFFNSPIKIFEYMAMGKPIIATDVGQQGQVIQDNFNGVFCEENSPDSLVEIIIYLYKNKELSMSLSENARNTALSKYDWKFNAIRIIRAYYNIINKRKVNDIDEQSIFSSFNPAL